MTETASPDPTTTTADPNAAETAIPTQGDAPDGLPRETDGGAVVKGGAKQSEASEQGDLATTKPGKTQLAVDIEDGERPAKRRRTRQDPPSTPDGTGTRRPKAKPISPPWKKAAADGPSSFHEGGRRKSGRINAIQLELQPTEKRTTRRGAQASPAPKTSGHATPETPEAEPEAPKPSPPSRRQTTRHQPARTGHSLRSQRGSSSAASRRAETAARTSRVRLRHRALTIPVVHPEQAKGRPRLAGSLAEYFDKAADVPVEEGGLFASEDGPRMTEAMAAHEAALLERIEREAEPGGLLAAPRCSAFEPEPAEEPPRQWAHMDHLVKAMANFRRLMGQEQARHRSVAKKLVEACRDEWLRRQPKTAEQIEAEARAMWVQRYRLVVRAMLGTWENVRAEVNRKRLEEWEAEQQRRRNMALQETLALSERKMQAQARRAQEGDEEEEDSLLEDEDSSKDESDESDESNMSSEEDEEEDERRKNDDENLTQEQLRLKYANLPGLAGGGDKEEENEKSEKSEKSEKDENEETSDESVDMDDDLGSTDMSEEEEAEETSDDQDDQASGLLGMLFGKKELKQMAESTADSDEVESAADESAVADESVMDVDESALMEEENEEVSMIELPGVEGEDEENEEEQNQVEKEKKERDEMEIEEKEVEEDEKEKEEKEKEKAVTSPETAATTAVSQSPARTSETKPSDVETAVSRSVSPAPTAATTSGPKTEIPFLLRGQLREYQHYGLDWLAGLYANKTNGILADEMGLGKTIQTIALLAHLACHHEVWGPHLVIVPTSVILNWEMEFKKWCPAFKILTYYGTQDERKRKRTGWSNNDVWNVCITSYQIVVQDQQVFKRRRWHYMILDEAHNIKNFKSQRWQSLLGFNTHSRLLLTGTPLQNNLTELWSLLFFLMPPEKGEGGFADLHEFHDWFHKPESQILESGREQMDEEARAIIAKLHQVLRPYLLRRLKADVEKQMPAKYEHVELCRLSKRQRELYDGFLARSDTRATLSSGNYLSIINCLMQLRKVCNHPDLFVDRPIMTSFRQPRSVAAVYQTTAEVVKRLLAETTPRVSLLFLNLVPTAYEGQSGAASARACQLATNRVLPELREAQRARLAQPYPELDARTVQSNLAQLESVGRWRRFEELQHGTYVNALRRQQRPVYGRSLVEFLTLGLEKWPFRPRPRVPARVMEWFENESGLLRGLVQPLGRRSENLETLIGKFACVTPAVVTRDMNEIVLGRAGVEAFRECDLRLAAPVKRLPFMAAQAPRDPWHEARMRLTIQFPDKRLLQYDCGKLQALDRLLRRLQAGGHRALIFTQMTKVLDILEQFLNIHGHKYLRLDGATKIEQRQVLTDRFNHDSRILCFILSTRSGGLGINLTGADTVIFYDQDWNPAMDKQCQDRCHRIGQTRDVHIYRLVSEHTIEANILRKASQKQMLDDVVIQEGAFTTDYFLKKQLSVRDVIDEDAAAGSAVANAAMDRVLGGVETADQRTAGRVLEQVEDREDVAAARLAEREILQDDADFSERAVATPAAATPVETGLAEMEPVETTADAQGTAETEVNAFGGRMRTIDDYMLRWMGEQLAGTVLELPRDKKRRRKDRKR